MTLDEDEEKQFWEGWLDKELGEYMEKVRTAVRKLYEDNRQQHGDLPYYTPHGPEHCEAVEDLLHRLIPGKNFNELKKKERFYLLASAWLHDIGMLRSVAQAVYKIEGMSENEIRKRHHITAAKYIADSWYNCGLKEIDKTILGKLCRYHRKQEDINKCEKEHLVGTEKFRLRLLAAYLRLADALDVGPTRMPSETYAVHLLYHISADAKIGWIKSELVNGIDIDPENHDISIEFKVPFPDDPNISSIIAVVSEDIREQLSRVMNITRQDGPTYYLDVKERRVNVDLDSRLLNDLGELTIYDLYTDMSSFSLGIYTDNSKIRRHLPGKIFLSEVSERQEERIGQSLATLCNAFDLDVVKEYPAVILSFVKAFFLKTRDALDTKELHDRLRKIERSLELEMIDKKQAVVDSDQAKAVRALLDSIKNTPNAVMQIGSLLVIKVTDEQFGERIITKSLNPSQMIFVNENPELLTEPRNVLHALSAANARGAGFALDRQRKGKS